MISAKYTGMLEVGVADVKLETIMLLWICVTFYGADQILHPEHAP